MRVLHVVTAFPRDDDDVITPWLGQLLLGLRAHGIEAEVLAPSYLGGGAREWRGIPVHRFRYAPRRWERLTHEETAPDRLRRRPWYGALVPPYVLSGAVAAFHAGLGRPDVVHVHWPVPHALFGAMTRLASGGRTAVVSSYYSVELRWVEERLSPLLPFLRWTIESADAVTAISTTTSRAVRHHVDRPVRVVPFAAGLGPAGPPPAPLRDRDSARGPEILFVGRLVERKGVEVLLHALAALEAYPLASLTVVGEGALEGRIRATVAALGLVDRVRLTGRLSEKELATAYERAHVFVLPAVVDAKGDTEGLGVVLLEALRFGVPVVGSRAGGIPDIVIDGETGWLVPPGDVGALATAMGAVLGDPAEAARRVALGQTHVERGFSLAGVVRSLTECYEEAIVARTGRGP